MSSVVVARAFPRWIRAKGPARRSTSTEQNIQTLIRRWNSTLYNMKVSLVSEAPFQRALGSRLQTLFPLASRLSKSQPVT